VRSHFAPGWDVVSESAFRSWRGADNIRGGIMRIVRSHPLLHAAILSIVCITAARAEEKTTDTFSQQELRARIEYCKTCHGISGQGFRGAFPMPRLAGKQPEYFENQLRAFIERRRTNPVMFNVAHVLNPSMITALAEHFKDLNPEPLSGAPKELEGAGKKLRRRIARNQRSSLRFLSRSRGERRRHISQASGAAA
jgi:cytochrome c553